MLEHDRLKLEHQHAAKMTTMVVGGVAFLVAAIAVSHAFSEYVKAKAANPELRLMAPAGDGLEVRCPECELAWAEERGLFKELK